MKICSKCKHEKPLNDFTLSKKSKDGYLKRCKECISIQRSQHYGFQDVTKVPKVIKDYAKEQMKKHKKVKNEAKHKYVLLLNYGKDKIKKSWTTQTYPKRITY